MNYKKNENDDNGGNKKSKNGSWAEFNRSFGLVFNIGYFISASVIIGLFAGYYIDAYFNTRPVFTLILTFAGIITGMMEIFKITKIK